MLLLLLSVVMVSANYMEAMSHYLGGEALKCLRQQERDGWSFEPLTRFFIVGLEGAGHHMVNSLNESIAGRGSGRKDSYPNGRRFRIRGDDIGCLPRIKLSRYSKFMILLRDPVDSFSSALNRFWSPNNYSVDTLAQELDEFRKAVLAMHREIMRIPCAKRLYLPFEWLTHHTKEATNIMAAFLGVSPDDANLLAWASHINQRSHASLPWPGPFPYPCSSRYARLAEKLVAEGPRLPRDWAVNASCARVDEPAIAHCILTAFRAKLEAHIYGTLRGGLSDQLAHIAPAQRMSYCAPPLASQDSTARARR